MILCCGEALMDLLPLPGIPGALHPLPGGGPFNTAIALARLGQPVAFCAPLSRDGFGTGLLARLTEEGVSFAGSRCPEPTPLAVVSLDARGHAGYGFYTEGTALTAFTEDLLPDPAAVQAGLFGGISLAATPTGAVLEGWAERLRRAGKLVMIDPNLRPAVVTDNRALKARLERMLPAADILKVSDEDLALLSPDAERQISEWLDAGVRLICLSRGAKGLRLITRRFDLGFPAEPTSVVDTIGAGDSLNAGLLTALREAGFRTPGDLAALEAADLTAAAVFAQRVAARTCSRPGADPPRRAELA